MVRPEKDARLFFALWPQAEVRAQLNRAAGTIPQPAAARRVPAANLHLTLHFVGNVYREEMACLQRQARRVRLPGFELEVDCTGSFSGPKAGWLGCREIPDALSRLHRQLGLELSVCGFVPEDRRYNPHITVLRKSKLELPAASFRPIHWPVSEFTLVESKSSRNGVQYRVVESYPLT